MLTDTALESAAPAIHMQETAPRSILFVLYSNKKFLDLSLFPKALWLLAVRHVDPILEQEGPDDLLL